MHNYEGAGNDIQIVNCLPSTISLVQGPLAQSVERGADNAKVALLMFLNLGNEGLLHN